jgi:twitching motility protein PilT
MDVVNEINNLDIETLFKISVKRNASDLHLSTGSPPLLRIDGELVILENIPILNGNTIKKLVYSIMDQDQQHLFESSLELDFFVLFPHLAGFRVNVFYQLHGIAAVFRIIPPEIPTLDKLNSPPIFKELLKLYNGLILITGPTGCGKTTTLAAMIDYINSTQSSHIITIEDPIEFIHQNKKSLINQRQVFRETTSFNAALRSALREDPDVILVGEMRDLETIRLALTAAETGHLVLATLHTSSAPRAISRIIDVFPSGEKNIIRNLISESLQAVICQTLVKKINGGRGAAYEILLGTHAIRNLIREDKIAQMYSVIQTNAKIGMCTMQQSLQKLVVDKLITQAEANESINEKGIFEKN